MEQFEKQQNMTVFMGQNLKIGKIPQKIQVFVAGRRPNVATDPNAAAAAHAVAQENQESGTQGGQNTPNTDSAARFFEQNLTNFMSITGNAPQGEATAQVNIPPQITMHNVSAPNMGASIGQNMSLNCVSKYTYLSYFRFVTSVHRSSFYIYAFEKSKLNKYSSYF